MMSETEERAYTLMEIEKYNNIRLYLKDQLDIVDMRLKDFYEELKELSNWKRELEKNTK